MIETRGVSRSVHAAVSSSRPALRPTAASVFKRLNARRAFAAGVSAVGTPGMVTML